MPSPAPLSSQRCASMLQRKLRLKPLGFGFELRQVAAYTCCSSVQDPLRAPAILLLEGRVQILSVGRGVEGKAKPLRVNASGTVRARQATEPTDIIAHHSRLKRDIS
jgi:hypothetical protein